MMVRVHRGFDSQQLGAGDSGDKLPPPPPPWGLVIGGNAGAGSLGAPQEPKSPKIAGSQPGVGTRPPEAPH